MSNSDHTIFFTFTCGSPIRSLIESGFGENEKVDVSLFYGARNLQRMAYQVGVSLWSTFLSVNFHVQQLLETVCSDRRGSLTGSQEE